MKDTIIQEVRDARAAVAADFGNDLHKFFAWAKSHANAEKKAMCRLPISPQEMKTAAMAKKTKSPRPISRRIARNSS